MISASDDPKPDDLFGSMLTHSISNVADHMTLAGSDGCEWVLVMMPKGRAVTRTLILSSPDLPIARAVEALEVAAQDLLADDR
jgi:hypothetical protein